jgi:hypothetical protein
MVSPHIVEYDEESGYKKCNIMKQRHCLRLKWICDSSYVFVNDIMHEEGYKYTLIYFKHVYI